MAKTDWVKLTIRLRPETHYLLNKHCPSEPAVVIRSMIEKLVSRYVRMAEEERRLKENGGDCTSRREPDSGC
jgi:hypothetical protein